MTRYPWRKSTIAMSMAAAIGAASAPATAFIGNAIFIHPDGTALNHWHAARIFWKGPDGSLEYDKLPEIVVYRGHMSDQLTGTSNGGATTHAFGVKVQGPDSYGRDRGRDILALSGYPGSFLREAGCYGHPIGVINDGDIAGEPGTGAFLAETDTRGEPNEQTRQLLEGRPGFEKGNDCDPRTSRIENDGDRLPDVILGGGERFFLPQETLLCRELPLPPPADNLPLNCAAHTDAFNGRGPARDDGRNLLELAEELGYVIMRTRAEFEKVKAMVEADSRYAPRLLGLFAADDIFNDETEEELIDAGLIRDSSDPLPQEGEEYGPEKIGTLVLWGQKYNQYGPDDPNYTFNPPTVAEMTELGLEVLERRSRAAFGRPFGIVIEVESTDNMPNNNNAMGTLRALKRADDTIGVARDFIASRDRQTLVITGADSDGSGIQLLNLTAPADSIPDAPTINVNSFFDGAGDVQRFEVATDGIEGANTQAFVAEPDAQLPFRPFPNEATGAEPIPAVPLVFSIAWPGFNDFAGGILTRAEGVNARLLSEPRGLRPGEPPLSERFDNSDIYRMVYATLFGRRLPSSVGIENETR